jgi:putative restriction endonuclease
MNYWWVNHKQTHAQELGGGYLWSPFVERDGKFSQYYYNMRLARAGDRVISYADGAIRALGTVVDGAIPSPRPEEFGKAGQNWASIGWLVPVAWALVSPIRPKTILSQLAPLLPAKYSPIQPATGDGNQKAYLSKVSEALFEVVHGQSSSSPPDIELTGNTADAFKHALEDATEGAIQRDQALSDTEKEQLVKARRGQGIFRKRLFALEHECRLTGVQSPSLLIASHIKPWRLCATAFERLDGSNGLLLAPHADFVFDRGLISFAGDGRLLISPHLSAIELNRLRLPTTLTTQMKEEQHTYMEYHRDVVFQT